MWTGFPMNKIISIFHKAKSGATRALWRKYAIYDATFYILHSKPGGMKVPEEKRLKALEEENVHLRTLLREAMLDKKVFQMALARKQRRQIRPRFCARMCRT